MKSTLAPRGTSSVAPWLLATLVLFVLLNWVLPRALSSNVRAITALLVTGSGFQRDGVYVGIEPPNSRAKLELFGSWLGSDDSTGRVTSNAFPIADELEIWVSGYPTNDGNSLLIELDEHDGYKKRLTPSWPRRENPGPASSFAYQTPSVTYGRVSSPSTKIADFKAGLVSPRPSSVRGAHCALRRARWRCHAW